MDVPAEPLKPEMKALRLSHDARYSLESKAKKKEKRSLSPRPRNGACTYADPRLEPRKPAHWRPPFASKPLNVSTSLWYELCVAPSHPWLIVVVVVGKVEYSDARTPFEEFEPKLGLTCASWALSGRQLQLPVVVSSQVVR